MLHLIYYFQNPEMAEGRGRTTGGTEAVQNRVSDC
jgi:hypothetical protein